MRFQRDPWRREANERRAKDPKNKDATKATRLRWLEANADKRAAHVILGNAVRRGDVKRPSLCEKCNQPPTGEKGLHGHHDDYTKPLDVVWLCAKCHVQHHLSIGTNYGPKSAATF